MRRVTEIPYEPHRYADELPNTAWANALVWDSRVRAGDEDALALARDLGLGSASLPGPDRIDALLYGVALGVAALLDGKAQEKAIVAVFGSHGMRDVHALFEAIGDDPLVDDEARATFLQERILGRVEWGRHNDADVAWLQSKAAAVVVDDDFMGTVPFQGDETESTELERRVVRARREHTCYLTGLPIAAGERHLVLREVAEGQFTTTRHSAVAAWFEAHAGVPAERLIPAEPIDTRRAA
ncbi:hypothetical protein MKK88_30830 [Methylobacterium sp. E-005]|uniref:hypothetical protein n=1 Tax=Methylobacterium sp. E-005 TaxID=2836549 RepID=UPI001FB99333|nr:hypothetical protein [Methylobacterium sp. E-005]MCJ2090348.1 hypothetical protein [Methylobacterium sp. E-005]